MYPTTTVQSSPGPTYSGRPRTVRTPINVALVKTRTAHDAEKDEDDPTSSPVATARKNPLGLTKSSWNRITVQERLHPYRMVR